MANGNELILDDAPHTGYPYGRRDAEWYPVPEEPPQDDQAYVRKYLQWIPAEEGGGIPDVPPNPPIVWGRATGRWMELPSASGIYTDILPPVNPGPDTLWWDTSRGKLYLWYVDSPSGAQAWVQLCTTSSYYAGPYIP